MHADAVVTGRVRNVLAVAGSDPSGGAGVQADLKTFAAFGVYGGAVITALTAQNTIGIAGVNPVDASFVALQLQTVVSDMALDAVKVGMLGSASVVRSVAAVFRACSVANIVVDPVLRASTGSSLLGADGVVALREELLPLAHVITPNAAEAGVLLSRAAPASLRDMHDAARALRKFGSAYVLVTGGHVATGADCVDVLCDQHGITHELRSIRIGDASRHGTGCTLSSAIAALLALGRDVAAACEEAQAYVGAAIVAAGDLAVGHGAGPLHHIPFSAALPARHV